MEVGVHINYGEALISTGLDSDHLLAELRPSDVPACVDPEREIALAVRKPIGSRPLGETVKQGQRIVILGDDATRPTPTAQIIPVLLDELNASGIPDEDVTLVVALGTHRPMTATEMEVKYGSRVIDRIRVVNHNYLADDLVHYGTTQRGTDIWVNRTVVEADVRVAVGNIVPHYPTGWSGGAKIMLPGVAGEHTTAQMHLLGAREHQLGVVDTPCRQEMEDFVSGVGLEFLVNTVLNRNGKLVSVVAGHFIDAHREGVRRARRVFGIPLQEKADICVSSPHPMDGDLLQASKGIFSAVEATCEGGEIILVSPCRDGVSPTHSGMTRLGGLDGDELWELAQRRDHGHDPLGIAEMLYLNTALRSFRITLVTEGILPEVARELGLNHVAPQGLSDYLARRLAEEDRATVSVLHNSAELLPLYRPSAR